MAVEQDVTKKLSVSDPTYMIVNGVIALGVSRAW